MRCSDWKSCRTLAPGHLVAAFVAILCLARHTDPLHPEEQAPTTLTDFTISLPSLAAGAQTAVAGRESDPAVFLR